MQRGCGALDVSVAILGRIKARNPTKDANGRRLLVTSNLGRVCNGAGVCYLGLGQSAMFRPGVCNETMDFPCSFSHAMY